MRIDKRDRVLRRNDWTGNTDSFFEQIFDIPPDANRSFPWLNARHVAVDKLPDELTLAA